jgi:hypothetical protein
MEYVNLDVVSSEDKGVVIGGEKFIYPSDIPTNLMLDALNWSQVLGKEPTNTDAYSNFITALYNILIIKQPKLKIDTIKSLGFKKLVALFSLIYAGVTPEQTQKRIDEETKKKE